MTKSCQATEEALKAGWAEKEKINSIQRKVGSQYNSFTVVEFNSLGRLTEEKENTSDD